MVFKLTKQRKAIISYFENNYTHPTVHEVYEEVKKELSNVSKKTIYLNLKLLEKENLLKEVKINNIQHFELKQEDHYHIVCTHCNKISDFDSNELNDMLLKLNKEIRDFKIQNTKTTIYGICKKCQEKTKKGK